MRIAPFLASAALACAVVPAFAGTIGWPEGDPIISHVPGQSGGPAADTAFIDFGILTWQLEADDFVLSQAATLRRVSWYGFYGGTFSPPEPAPATEVMRIRLYEARPSDGLPGAVLFEESFVDPLRIATGAYIILNNAHPEYLFQVDLTVPFQLAANVSHWIEIVQVGSMESYYRWETGIGDLNGRAFINSNTPDWQPVGTSDLAFSLWTIPEPSSVRTLASIVAMAVVLNRTRRRFL